MILSIIIPTYNVEKYIQQTLTSILSQMADSSIAAELEVVIIDDASTDATLSIINNLPEDQSKLIRTIINTEHHGVSSCRNQGIQCSQGQYLWFVDGDDLIHPNAIEILSILIKTYPDADMLTFTHIKFSDGCFPDFPTGFAQTAPTRYDTVNSNDICRLFPAFIKKTLFVDAVYNRNRYSQLLFENFSHQEDAIYKTSALLLANRVYTTTYPLYAYRIRMTSATNSWTETAYRDRMAAIMRMVVIFRSHPVWSDIRPLLYKDVQRRIDGDGIWLIKKISNDCWKDWFYFANQIYVNLALSKGLSRARYALVCSIKSPRLTWVAVFGVYVFQCRLSRIMRRKAL